MTREQKKQIRALYARTLAAGDGDRETMPAETAERLAQREKMSVILDLIGDHPNMEEILGDDDFE